MLQLLVYIHKYRIIFSFVESIGEIKSSFLTMSVFRAGLFKDCVAVVTGGGTGIGKAITKELVTLGCKVIIASRKLDVLENCANAINREVRESMVYPIQCNIREETEVIIFLLLA